MLRHIDVLEEALGTRLFQRHARGYTPTEAGLDLKQVAQATQEQLEAFAGRARGRGNEVTGELVVTSVDVASPLVVQAAARFRALHPSVLIRHVVSSRVLELAYGEAHVAVRAGSKPGHPDNVALPVFKLSNSHQPCMPTSTTRRLEVFPEASRHSASTHSWPPQRSAAVFRWLESYVPRECVALQSDNALVLRHAIHAGIGIGFAPCFEARRDPHLIEVLPRRVEWEVPFWLVTHVDLHRSPKVQALLKVLRAVAEEVAKEDGVARATQLRSG